MIKPHYSSNIQEIIGRIKTNTTRANQGRDGLTAPYHHPET